MWFYGPAAHLVVRLLRTQYENAFGITDGYTPAILEKLDDTHERISKEDENDLERLPSDLIALPQSSDDVRTESPPPQETSDMK